MHAKEVLLSYIPSLRLDFFVLNYICVHFACTYVCVPSMCGPHRAGFLVLELQLVVGHHLVPGTEPRSSLQGQRVFLTSAPSLQLLTCIL